MNNEFDYKAAGFKLICGSAICTGRRAVVAIMPVPQTISVLIFCQMCLCPRTPLADDLVAPDDLRRLSTCRILPLFICETGLQIDGSQVGAECEWQVVSSGFCCALDRDSFQRTAILETAVVQNGTGGRKGQCGTKVVIPGKRIGFDCSDGFRYGNRTQVAQLE